MKTKFFGAITTIALLAGLSAPAVAQVSVNYDYVYFAAGSHQRQPPASATDWLVPIQSDSGGQQAAGDKLITPPNWPPCPLVVHTEQYVGSGKTGHLVPVTLTYNFAFMTVIGGSPLNGGPLTSFQCGTQVSAVVGTSPIVVQAVYVPAGGGGGGGQDSGATIDSYDTTTGTLFDDTFVSVSPDSTGALTKSGNVYGWVDTWNSAETINALSPSQLYPSGAPDTGVNFSQWVTLASTSTGSATSNGSSLNVGKQQSTIALAFYKGQPQTSSCSGGETCGYCPKTCKDGCYLFRPGQTVGICRVPGVAPARMK